MSKRNSKGALRTEGVIARTAAAWLAGQSFHSASDNGPVGGYIEMDEALAGVCAVCLSFGRACCKVHRQEVR